MRRLCALVFVFCFGSALSAAALPLLAEAASSAPAPYAKALREAEEVRKLQVARAEGSYNETVAPLLAAYERAKQGAGTARASRIREAEEFFRRESTAAEALQNPAEKKTLLQAVRKRLAAEKAAAEKVYKEALLTAQSGLDARRRDPLAALNRAKGGAEETFRARKSKLDAALGAYKTANGAAEKAARASVQSATAVYQAGLKEAQTERRTAFSEAEALFAQAKQDALSEFAEAKAGLPSPEESREAYRSELKRITAEKSAALAEARKAAEAPFLAEQAALKRALADAKRDAASLLAKARVEAERVFRAAEGL